ncbi:MAG: fused MFS/spermidine synthase, partial [Candidatus Chisholmbacteria bacterium]|nr:fused MFS/spermidine synthase [Candidatus Chisholmbacteria bacterium]
MFFFPELVETKTSRFNGTIKVYKLFGHYSLSVDNLTQSGGLVKNIWHKALKRITNYKLQITNCLILGLGGGTSADLVNKIWPNARITGIEIDPQMVKLGKKYFSLGNISHLKIITADAFKRIYTLYPIRYSLILVDLYHGKSFPREATTPIFSRHLKRLLKPKGTLIINRLNYAHNEKDINQHVTILKKVFPHVTAHKILSNILVFCSL